MWQFLFSLILTAPLDTHDVVERVVAVVDQRVITMSEVERVARLEIARRKGQVAITEVLPPDYLEDVRRHLISDSLLVAEANRFGATAPTALELGAVETQLRERFATAAAYVNFLQVLPFKEDEVRDYLRRDLWVNKFIESKLRARIEITPMDRTKYRADHPDAASWNDKDVNAEITREQLVEKSRAYLLDLCERAEVRVIGRFDPNPEVSTNPCSSR